jgi:hypothetical protein
MDYGYLGSALCGDVKVVAERIWWGASGFPAGRVDTPYLDPRDKVEYQKDKAYQ